MLGTAARAPHLQARPIASAQIAQAPLAWQDLSSYGSPHVVRSRPRPPGPDAADVLPARPRLRRVHRRVCRRRRRRRSRSLVIAGGLRRVQFFASDKLALRAMGAPRSPPQEAPELHAMIERLCVQADLPKPKVAVVRHPDAQRVRDGPLAEDATVCATTGIMELLSPGRARGRDGPRAHPRHQPRRDDHDAGELLRLDRVDDRAVRLLLRRRRRTATTTTARASWSCCSSRSPSTSISFFLMQALSRYREFAADRGAAVITGRPSALASALMKISGTMERIPQSDLRAHAEMNAFYIFPAEREAVARQPVLDPPAAGEADRGARSGSRRSCRARAAGSPPDGLPRRAARASARSRARRPTGCSRCTTAYVDARDRARASRPAARRRSSSSRSATATSSRSSRTWRRCCKGTGEETGSTVETPTTSSATAG